MRKILAGLVAIAATSICLAAAPATRPAATQTSDQSDTPPASDPTPPGKPPKDMKYVYIKGEGWRIKAFTQEEKSYATLTTYKTHGKVYCYAFHDKEDDALAGLSHLQDLEVIDSEFVQGPVKGWWRIYAIDRNGHGGMVRYIQGASGEAAFEHLKKYLSVYQDNGKPRFDLLFKSSQELKWWNECDGAQFIIDGDPKAPPE